MKWSKFSTPLICISSAIALFHVVHAHEPNSDQIQPPARAAAAAIQEGDQVVFAGVGDNQAEIILDDALSPSHRNPVYSSGRNDAQLSRHDQRSQEQRQEPRPQQQKEKEKFKSTPSVRDQILKALSTEEKETFMDFLSPDEQEALLNHSDWEKDIDARIAKLKQWIASRPNKKPNLNRNGDNNDSYAPVRHDVRPSHKTPTTSSPRPLDDSTVNDGMADPTGTDLRNPCHQATKSLGSPTSYEIVKACLDSDFPFPRTLRQDTIATMKNLLSNFYVFEDLVAHPPKTGEEGKWLSFRPVELLKELDRHLELGGGVVSRNDGDGDDDEEEDDDDDVKLHGKEKEVDENVEEVDNTDQQEGDLEDEDEDEDDEISGAKKDKRFVKLSSLHKSENAKKTNRKDGMFRAAADIPHVMTHREFHDGLNAILGKARDGHLSYDADCFRAFRWQQGIFMSHVVRDGRTVVKVHSVTPYFQKVNGVSQDLLNCEVVTIEGRDTADYIQDWADNHVTVSKDANVRFNGALATPQYRSGTTDFFLPGKFGERFITPEKGSLTHVFRCPGRTPQQDLTVDVKWVGLYMRRLTAPFHDAQSYYEVNCMKATTLGGPFGSGGGGGGGSGGGEEDRRLRLEKEQDPVQKNITLLKSVIRELLLHPVTATVPPVASASVPVSNLTAAATLTSIPIAAATATPIAVAPTFPAAEPKIPEEFKNRDVDDLLDELDLLSSEQLPVVKYYDDHGGRPSGMDRSYAAQFTELYKGLHGISALLLADGKTGVITVRTESSTNKGETYSRFHSEWIGSLIKSIEVLRPRAKKVILDLSHNTGGYVCLGLTMIQLFFPERPRLVTNIRLSPLATQMMSAGALGVDHFISSYGNSTAAAYQNGYLLRPTAHPHRNMTFTDFVSDRCSITDRYELKWSEAEERARGRPYMNPEDESSFYHPWDPENIVILTDGYCGSSCALITNMLHTKFGVKTVVVGGRSQAKTSGVPMSYSTFPGLQVIDDSLIFNEMHEVRASMMSRRELDRLEQIHVVDKPKKQQQQVAFAIKGQVKEEEEAEIDGSEDDKHITQGSSQQSADNDDDDEEEDEDDDSYLDSFYPVPFAHQSRLRLTWRQIYNTGKDLTMFKQSMANRNTFEPVWKEVDSWDEFSFLPADFRIDYTDHNIHSVGAIWEDARNVTWGKSWAVSGAEGEVEVAEDRDIQDQLEEEEEQEEEDEYHEEDDDYEEEEEEEEEEGDYADDDKGEELELENREEIAEENLGY